MSFDQSRKHYFQAQWISKYVCKNSTNGKILNKIFCLPISGNIGTNVNWININKGL